MQRIAAALALLLLACPPHGGNEEKSGGPQTSTTTTNPQQVPGNTSRMNPATETSRTKEVPVAMPEVQVDLTEYSINMTDSLPAGKHVLQITNHGEQKHGFVIEGGSVHREVQALMKGDSTTLEIDLAPGTYTVYCPVDGHKGKGMQKTINVTGSR